MANRVEYELSLRDMFTNKMAVANTAVNKLEQSISSAKSRALGLGSALGIAFGVAGVVQFTKSVISAGATVENALTGLTTLLKDGKEAQQVINNTMEDATKTPFAFEGLLAANKALISAGVNSKSAREDVLNLANAIAATGGGDDELQRMVINLQQIKNTGEATALDIKQFAYAGINLYKVLGEAGIKVEKGNKDQAITYAQITTALKKAHESGGIYANGLENMSNNTSVKISNLGDAFFQLSVKIFNDLKPAIEAVLGAMFKFVDWLKKAWEWMVKNKEILKTLALAIGAAWAAFKLISGARAIILSIQIALQAMAASAVGASTATSGLAASMTAAMGPIGAVTLAVGALVGAFIALQENARIAKEMKQQFFEDEKKLAVQDLETNIKGAAEVLGDKKAREMVVAKEIARLNKEQLKSTQDLTVAQTEYEKAKKNVSRFWNTGTDAVIKAKENLDKAKENLILNQKGFEAVSEVAAGPKKGLVPSKDAKGLAQGASKESKKKGEKNQATGSKAVTINLSIRELIGTSNINVTNVKESATKLKDIVVQALTGAVNDFQITAGS